MNIILEIRNALILSCLVIVILLSGCDKNRHLHDLQKQIEDLKKPEPPQKSIALNLVTPTPSTYKSSTLRHPFTETETLPTQKNISSDPLQKFPLSMLRFVGTLTQNSRPFAYILTPDNKIYSAKVGDTIGDRHGKIRSIYANRVEIIEIETDESNQQTQRLVTLQLKE